MIVPIIVLVSAIVWLFYTVVVVKVTVGEGDPLEYVIAAAIVWPLMAALYYLRRMPGAFAALGKAVMVMPREMYRLLRSTWTDEYYDPKA